MKKNIFALLLTICSVCNSQAQDQIEFPKDPITNKFTLSQVVEMPGKTKIEIFQSVKGIESKFTAYNWEKKEKDVYYKGLNLSNLPRENIDSSRLFYKIQLAQVTKFKLSGNNSYGGFIGDLYIYVKDGKYKIELTNFSISEINMKLSGSADAIEEKNSSNKKWLKIKGEILADATIIKEKIIESIFIYFKKSDF